MAEVWDLIDVHRNLTGETWTRGTKAPIPLGRYHVIVSIWTVTPEGRILITRRHPLKSFGGLWENTGGAAKHGETSEEAAKRELREETGLDTAEGQMIFLGDVWHQGNVVDTYLFKKDFDIDSLKLQAEEVVDARLAGIEEIDELHHEGIMVPSVYRTFCSYRKDIMSAMGL